jgi:RNA polymerase sigma-70 factor (ECF subfamily)
VSKELERAVVEDLYRRYWFQVEARCRRILAGPEALDAAQEVFVRLITSGGEFRAESEWMTWLYRVATNICLNRIRDQQRRGARWQADALAATAGSEVDLERLFANRERLIEVLGRFDQKTQQIAIHYFLDEMTQDEIGEVLSLSRVSVNKRLQRFRKEVESMNRGRV